MVYIVFSESHGFVIHWQRGQGDEVREETVPSPQAPGVFVASSTGSVRRNQHWPNKRMKASGGKIGCHWWRLPVPAALSWTFVPENMGRRITRLFASLWESLARESRIPPPPFKASKRCGTIMNGLWYGRFTPDEANASGEMGI